MARPLKYLYAGGLKTVNPKRLESQIQEIRTLLSQLQSELSFLEKDTLQAFRATALDDLTGCLRRNALLEEGLELAHSADLSPDSENSFHAVLMDLDHFKNINDSYGHPEGDEVLIRIGECLRRYTSLGLLVGRWGGEEFVILFKGSNADRDKITECIRSQVEALLFSESFQVTLSMGVSSVSSLEISSIPEIEKLIGEADQALYLAKANGRNRIEVA